MTHEKMNKLKETVGCALLIICFVWVVLAIGPSLIEGFKYLWPFLLFLVLLGIAVGLLDSAGHDDK